MSEGKQYLCELIVAIALGIIINFTIVLRYFFVFYAVIRFAHQRHKDRVHEKEKEFWEKYK